MSSRQNLHPKKVVWVCALAFILVVSGAYLFTHVEPKTASADRSRFESAINDKEHTPFSYKTFRILHIMSYHIPWKWTDDQLDGFKAALKDVNVEYNVIQMDMKRRSDEPWKQQIITQTHKAIETWKPDLIFTGDDNVQLYVAKDYVNTGIPIVFCAVNEDPATYGFTGSKNVTGVLERMHYGSTLRLLKKLVPSVKRVAILTDTGKMWSIMIDRMKQQESTFPDIDVVSYDTIPTFEQFKQKVLDYQNKVDALGFFGVFEFKDENGNHVLLEDVQKWLLENSNLPSFSFWKDRVDKGTLCAVSVSGYAQGYQAGLLARSILVDGKSPASLPMVSTEKGIPCINLQTARKLNINPSANVLLTAEVIQNTDLK